MNSLHTSKSTMVLALINIVSGSRIIATQLPSLINVVSDLNRNGSNIYAAIQCTHHFHLSISVVTYNHPIQRSLSAITNNNLQPQPSLNDIFNAAAAAFSTTKIVLKILSTMSNRN